MAFLRFLSIIVLSSRYKLFGMDLSEWVIDALHVELQVLGRYSCATDFRYFFCSAGLYTFDSLPKVSSRYGEVDRSASSVDASSSKAPRQCVYKDKPCALLRYSKRKHIPRMVEHTFILNDSRNGL